MPSITLQPADESATIPVRSTVGVNTDEADGAFPAITSHKVVLTVVTGFVDVDDSGGGEANAQIRYSTDGGGSWTNLVTLTTTGTTNGPFSVTLGGTVDLSQIQVQARAEVVVAFGGTNADAEVSDWEITYQPTLGIYET